MKISVSIANSIWLGLTRFFISNINEVIISQNELTEHFRSFLKKGVDNSVYILGLVQKTQKLLETDEVVLKKDVSRV